MNGPQPQVFVASASTDEYHVGVQPRLIGILVVAALVVLNTAGYLLYRQLVGSEAAENPAPSSALPAVAAPPTAAALPTPPPAVAAKVGDAESTLVRGYRAAGIQALEQGDYDAALENFEEAVRLGGKSDLPVLVRIASEMGDRAAGRTRPGAVAASDEQGPAAVPRRLGTLVVTSSPPNLEVTVNGRIVDTTPATIDLRHGKYWIGLLRDGELAFKRRIEIIPDEVASVNHDFTSGVVVEAAAPIAAAPTRPTEHKLEIAIKPLAGIDSDPGALAETAVTPTKPKPVKPVMVSYSELRTHQVEGTQEIAPPDVVVNLMTRSGTDKISARVALCTSADGKVNSRRIARDSGYAEYDRKLLEEVARWKFAPFERDGARVPVCSTVTFVFKTR